MAWGLRRLEVEADNDKIEGERSGKHARGVSEVGKGDLLQIRHEANALTGTLLCELLRTARESRAILSKYRS
jgi:hypothetical protein